MATPSSSSNPLFFGTRSEEDQNQARQQQQQHLSSMPASSTTPTAAASHKKKRNLPGTPSKYLYIFFSYFASTHYYLLCVTYIKTYVMIETLLFTLSQYIEDVFIITLIPHASFVLFSWEVILELTWMYVCFYFSNIYIL